MQTPFDVFLKACEGSKDVGLAIAGDRKERGDWTGALEASGYRPSKRVADLFRFSKTFFLLGRPNKDVYDFIVQYPTGQVEIFDVKAMRSRVLSPEYESRSVVLVTDESSLVLWKEKGFDIAGAVGPVYRS
ncbi:MAG: hypothetical protein Q7R83_02830 [bacterium]|nr:hypothetical protein [bacterium]